MNLTQEAIDFMTDLVQDYYRQNKSFTSVDIGNQTKQAGHFVRNRWVAEWLRGNAIVIAHNMSALYNSTLIRVDSKAEGITLAYLYHHMNVVPDSYLDRDQNPKSAPRATVPTPQPVTNTRTKDILDQIRKRVSHVPNVQVANITSSYQDTLNSRDVYGRFTSDPTAPVSKPTHFLQQKRDSLGRFIKD